ncbi:MAG: FHA domain-containing protein [Planctomycetota bacterium]
MKIRLFPPGQKPIEHDVTSNPAVIGRDPSCDVVVPLPFVSKRHVMIHSGVVVEDLDSFNGTLVDGEPIGRPALAPGGVFSLAGRMDVQVTGGAAAAETTAEDPELEALRTRTAVLERELATAAAKRDELAERVEELETKLRGGAPAATATPAVEDDDAAHADDDTMRTIVQTSAPETIVAARPADPLHTIIEPRGDTAGAAEGSVGVPDDETVALPGASGGTEVLGAFVADGRAGLAPSNEDRIDEAVLRSTLRCALGVERLVTELTAGRSDVDATHTVVAQFDGALRAHVRTALEDPIALEHRERLEEYLAGFERRLAAALRAPRAAAVDLARQIVAELSEDALSEDPPMPLLARVPGAREAELWRRAVTRLDALTDEQLGDRMELLEQQRVDRLLAGD